MKLQNATSPDQAVANGMQIATWRKFFEKRGVCIENSEIAVDFLSISALGISDHRAAVTRFKQG
jgi:hypothetical protein